MFMPWLSGGWRLARVPICLATASVVDAGPRCNTFSITASMDIRALRMPRGIVLQHPRVQYLVVAEMAVLDSSVTEPARNWNTS